MTKSKNNSKVEKLARKILEEATEINDIFTLDDRPTSFSEMKEASRMSKKFFKLLDKLNTKKIINNVSKETKNIITKLENEHNVYDPKEDF